MSDIKQIIVVLPVSNVEKTIKSVADKIVEILKKLINEDKISETSYLILIDNSSKDNTWYEMGKIVARNPFIVKAKRLKNATKTSSIIKDISNYLVVDYKTYFNIEQNLDKINQITKLQKLKDIFKTGTCTVIDELQ